MIKKNIHFLLGDYLQYGERSEPRFLIENEQTRHFRRFGYEGREIRGTISQPTPNTNIYAWLERCMDDLHRQLCRKAAETDFIGVTINSERFNHGPLWLSFRPVKNVTTKDLWEMLFTAVQSINDVNISDRLDISCALIRGTVGSG